MSPFKKIHLFNWKKVKVSLFLRKKLLCLCPVLCFMICGSLVVPCGVSMLNFQNHTFSPCGITNPVGFGNCTVKLAGIHTPKEQQRVWSEGRWFHIVLINGPGLMCVPTSCFVINHNDRDLFSRHQQSTCCKSCPSHLSVPVR